ncbi:unnamed protein product [Didymodactylos carnosus]|uniref:Uncharacterized protein n=2 Tax=Didymodactylos carnosus TaxID=1234261 RepID=A0A814T724_9BILA|nr:unnamed protein product [Didymodactylos carnosus]CAF3917746.1 unnamed protein product [Didymodactylos carnosus]
MNISKSLPYHNIKTPCFRTFSNNIEKQMYDIKTNGISVNNNKILVLIAFVTGDMPALSKMSNHVDHTAYYSCMWCYVKGQYLHECRCILFNGGINEQPRTDESYLNDIYNVQRYGYRDHYGVKEEANISLLIDTTEPSTFLIDGMHTIFLCHAKRKKKDSTVLFKCTINKCSAFITIDRNNNVIHGMKRKIEEDPDRQIPQVYKERSISDRYGDMVGKLPCLASVR